MELGFAEMKVPHRTSSSAPEDIPGMSFEFRAGGPVMFSFGGCLKNDVPGAYARVVLVVNGVIEGQIIESGYLWRTSTKEVRYAARPGEMVRAKLQMHSIGGGESELYSEDATQSSRDRAMLRAYHADMRIALSLALAASLAACGANGTPAPVAVPLDPVRSALLAQWPSNRTITIVAFGHSVPAGYTEAPTVAMRDAYPRLLHEALVARYPTAVVNVHVAAVGGENSSAGRERFGRDALSLRPDVVLIDYGLNDRNIGVAQARENLSAMIDAAHQAGAAVVLLTPTADTAGDQVALNEQAAMVRELAAFRGVALADSAAAFAAHPGGVAELMATSNHPSRAGHELVAAELARLF